MFARLYIEALLRDETLADAVWELWDAGLISADVAALSGGESPFLPLPEVDARQLRSGRLLSARSSGLILFIWVGFLHGVYDSLRSSLPADKNSCRR